MPYESKCDQKAVSACGLCASVCPEVFRMNDENVSEVYHQPTPEQEDATQEAADGCPVSVIEIE